MLTFKPLQLLDSNYNFDILYILLYYYIIEHKGYCHVRQESYYKSPTSLSSLYTQLSNGFTM